jgi:hypothetical protein
VLTIEFSTMCQINSWAPLQATKSMMERIIQHHNIDASFLEVPQSFYSRRTEQEQAHCVPFTMFQVADSCGRSRNASCDPAC